MFEEYCLFEGIILKAGTSLPIQLFDSTSILLNEKTQEIIKLSTISNSYILEAGGIYSVHSSSVADYDVVKVST
jgi:hypothetical protein